MGRQARKVKEDEDGELVQCQECDRWCYLDETGFGSLAEADEASFVCKMCKRFGDAVHALKGEWEAGFNALNADWQVEREARIKLEAQVADLIKKEENNAALLKRMVGEIKEEREKRIQLEKQVEALRSRPAGHPSSEKCQAGDEARQSYSAVVQRASSAKNENAMKKVKAGMETRDNSVQRQERQLERSGGQQMELGSERLGRRRVLVVGDSNVARVEGGVLTAVKADRRVQVEAQSGKCMVDAMARAREVVVGSMDGEHLVVIHAGLNDVLQGRSQNLETQLEVGMRRLREASESVHVTICTVPEVQRQARETERRVVETNRVIRLLSRRLRYEVMEVNREVYEVRPHPFAQDGIHYGGATGKKVGSRIGRQATAFLGGPRALMEPV
ncbi:uncharacterized protein LOC144112638 [Amblyomma americanum]